MMNSFVLCCNFCACKCAPMVVVQSPRGGWGTVTWQPSPRGWWGTVFPWVGNDKGGGVFWVSRILPQKLILYCTWPGCGNVSVASEVICFSMYYAEHFVFRNVRLFLHCCDLHVQPWLFGMQLATVCMSKYGPVYSVCTHQRKPIWAWNAVNCEPAVACCSHAVECP